MALTRREVIRTLRISQRDSARIADAFYRAKANAYRETLRQIGTRYGRADKRVVLSPEIRIALRREARDHARKVVASTNRAIEREARRRRDLSPYLLSRHLAAHTRERTRRRSDLIARHEVASARLDAQVAFFRENGIEPRFDFVGPRAKCRLCRRLKLGGPWPIDAVIRIGVPHIGCVHSWRARVYSPQRLRAGGIRPGTISAGRGPIAGIVGTDPLTMQQGSTEEALIYLDGVELAGQTA